MYFKGIDWAFLRCIILFTRPVQDWRDVEANCLDLEMHNPFSTAKKTLASDTLLLRLSSVPLKVTALAVSDGDRLVWKYFSLEAVKTGPRWDRRDWAAALVNYTRCPRIGTKGSLWVIFLAGCLEWVCAVVPHSTTLILQVLPTMCFSKLSSMMWVHNLGLFVSCCVAALTLVWLDTFKTENS